MSNNLITFFPFTEDISGTTIPSFPGAYVFIDAYNTGSTGMIPIYTSTIPSFNTDKQVIVLPGFKLSISSTNWENENMVENITVVDNSGGTDILFSNKNNNAISASYYTLYYKFDNTMNEIAGQAYNSTVQYGVFDAQQQTIDAPSSSGYVDYNGFRYNLYQYTGNGTFKISGGNNVRCLALIVAGGGGGANYTNWNGSWSGGGGGGAGAYVTTIINASANTSFNITVGAGGAGGDAYSIKAGYQGKTSSIVSSGSGVGIYAYGGGGGGSWSPDDGLHHWGRYDVSSTYYGSTAGAWGTNAARASWELGIAMLVTSSNVFLSSTAFANRGGDSAHSAGGGGGGGAASMGGTANGPDGGEGGAGKQWINNVHYAGGGGGGDNLAPGGSVGAGGSGGGAGSVWGADGTSNTGGGGAAGWGEHAGGNGGSGIVIIAVPISKL